MKTLLITAISVVLLTCNALSLSSKEKADTLADIYGKIFENIDKNRWGISYASVLLVTDLDGEPDSAYVTTSYDGVFIFKKLKPQKIHLRITHVNYKTIEGDYVIGSGRNAFYFKVEEKKEELESAKVSADATLMKQIKDTSVYNTAAVKTMEGESLRAVVEQLPGFKISKDRISVDGRSVSRTYVNGILVFGDNPVAAIDALKADEVTQIKVYDELSAIDRRRGLKGARKERVLDVVTKEPILQLTEAGIVAHGGADETGQLRYNTIGLVTYNSEMAQLSAYGFTDNISTLVSSSGKEGKDVYYGTNILNAAEMGFGALSSYKETGGAHFSANKYWKDRDYGNSANVSYDFRHTYEKSASRVLAEYFAAGDTPAIMNDDTTSNRATGSVHDFDISFNLLDTPLKSFDINVTGSVSDNAASGLSAMKQIADGTGATLSRHETTSSDSRDYQVGGNVSWTNNDMGKLKPFATLKFDFSNSSSESWTVDTLATSFDRRELNSDGFGRGINGSASVGIESILINDDKQLLSLSAILSSVYDYSKSRKMTIDLIESEEIDLANTYDNTWNGFDNTASLTLSYNRKSLMLYASVDIVNTLQSDKELFPQPPYSTDTGTWKRYGYDRSYWSAIPTLLLSYKSFNLQFSSSTGIPSIEQTRNRISDTNPLVLTGGNPELKKSYTTDGELRYMKRIAKGLGSLNASVSGQITTNPIVTRTQYFTQNTVLSEWDGYEAMAGAMLNTFENSTTPSWKTSANIGGNGMFFKRRLIVVLSGTAEYSSRPQYAGGMSVVANTFMSGGNININYRPNRKLRFSLNGTSYYSTSSNGTKELLSESVSISGALKADWNLAKNGSVYAGYSLSSIGHIDGIGSDFFNHDISAGIVWYFLKRSLSISLKAHNLLNTGTTYTNIVTADAVTQTWKPEYGRYYMLGIKYVFRKK